MKILSTFTGAALAAVAGLSLAVAPASAQVRDIDPDAAIDGDLIGEATGYREIDPAPPGASDGPAATSVPQSAGNGTPVDTAPTGTARPVTPSQVDTWNPDTIGKQAEAAEAQGQTTYGEDDLMGAATGVFGKGSEGLAGIIQDILAKQGKPNGYIVGREGSGAVGLGLRYGSGTLYHKIEGNRPVYWTGPSLGFDLGLNAGKAFVLVYNLHNSQDLYKRYGAGEGQAYLVGGFHVSYLRRGDVVLIPVRMGAGVRLGANVGYMKFSEKQRWLPL
ncbi:MAG: DUF1134 domain-containing protein [Sphingomonadaceae bacterium]